MSASSSRLSQASLECNGAVVVGAGIAGLAVAAALTNISGVQHIHILEKSSPADFDSSHQGAALILSPNGLKALRALGGEECLQQVLNEGSHIQGNAILHENNHDHQDHHRVIEDTTLQTTGLPQVLIRWGVLRRILKEVMDDTHVHISTNVEATSYQVCENARVQVINKDGCKIFIPNDNYDDDSTPLLIAADGIDSHFSKLLHPTKNIKDNGRVNIKAVINKSLPSKNGITYSYFEGNIACFAGPAGDDYTYWAISLPSSHEDHLETASVDLEKTKIHLLMTLSRIEVPPFIIELIQDTAPELIFVRQSQESIRVSELYSRHNVVLVGDAAHAMSPSYGQCGSMALEDAVTLACCIKMNDSLEEALSNYSQARTSRSEEMVKRSAERTKKAVTGEPTEDVSQWIFQWEPPCM